LACGGSVISFELFFNGEANDHLNAHLGRGDSVPFKCKACFFIKRVLANWSEVREEKKLDYFGGVKA